MAMPCSEKAYGAERLPPQLEVTICDFQVFKLFSIELKHEIGRKTLSIALHCLYKHSGFDLVEFGQVRTQHHFVMQKSAETV